MPLEDHELRTREGEATPPPGAIETALAGIPALPENTLILIPTRNLVLFPGTVLPITLGRQRTIAAAQAAIDTGCIDLIVPIDKIGSVLSRLFVEGRTGKWPEM